jgi:hypothetical protein
MMSEVYMTIRSSLIERSNRLSGAPVPASQPRAEAVPNREPSPKAEPPFPLRPHLTAKFGAAGSRSVRASIMARLKAVGGGPGASGRSWSQSVRAQAQARWGGALSTSQRVIVKAHVARHSGGAAAAGKVLAAHVTYLARGGTGLEGEAETFYGAQVDGVAAREHVKEWAQDRHHFRFIVSAEHGDRIDDLKAYMRETMQRVAADLKEPNLDWIAVNHFDTDQPHSHVLIRGRRADGRNLVIPRAVMGYGFRARAQEHAQELLGELTREQAEIRLRSQITADRETELDKSLARHLDEAGNITDVSVINRQGPYAAMMRGRLAHLQKLGLAGADGKSIAPDFRRQLAVMAARGDVVRLFHERLNAGARTISPLQQGSVRGDVVHTGYHDRDLQTSPYAIVRDSQGHEHYSRLSAKDALPKVGAQVALSKDTRGIVRLSELGAERQQRDTSRFSRDHGDVASKQRQAAQRPQTRESISDQLERQIKIELGLHKHFIGIKTTQTEGIYRGTLQTSGGQFAVIDRGASVAALRVEAAPTLQIGAQVSANIGRNGLAQVSIEMGLGL